MEPVIAFDFKHYSTCKFVYSCNSCQPDKRAAGKFRFKGTSFNKPQKQGYYPCKKYYIEKSVVQYG